MTLDPTAPPGVVAPPPPPAATIGIRPAAAADAAACGAIMLAAFRGIAAAHGFPPDFPSPGDAIGLATAMIADPAVFGVVAESGGRIVGSNFLAESDPVRAVGPITVDPACQGAGVGR
jgi:predicted N-acetyltransferase YhbS